MRRPRSPLTAVIALAVAVVLAPLLSGCFGNPLESVIEGATGGEVDLGGASVPDGFPREVPLYDGEITYGVSLGSEPDTIYNVTMRVPDVSALDSAAKQLEDAGFTIQMQGPATADGGTVIADSDAFGVLLVVAKDGDGFVANYSVSPKKANP